MPRRRFSCASARPTSDSPLCACRGSKRFATSLAVHTASATSICLCQSFDKRTSSPQHLSESSQQFRKHTLRSSPLLVSSSQRLSGEQCHTVEHTTVNTQASCRSRNTRKQFYTHNHSSRQSQSHTQQFYTHTYLTNIKRSHTHNLSNKCSSSL